MNVKIITDRRNPKQWHLDVANVDRSKWKLVNIFSLNSKLAAAFEEIPQESESVQLDEKPKKRGRKPKAVESEEIEVSIDNDDLEGDKLDG